MKKILGILSGIGLIATTGGTAGTLVTSCTIGDEVRDPKDLSQFTVKDFYGMLKGWNVAKVQDESKCKTGSEIEKDIKTVIIEYLKNNGIVLSNTEIDSFWVKTFIGNEAIVSDDEYSIAELFAGLKITAGMFSYTTIVKNQVNVEWQDFTIKTFAVLGDENSFESYLKSFDGSTILTNISPQKINIEALEKIVPKMINDSFKSFTKLTPARGQDYNIKLSYHGSSIGIEDKIDLTKDSIQITILDLLDQDDWMWSQNRFSFNFKITENNFELTDFK